MQIFRKKNNFSKDKRAFGYKRSKAQYLVEFVLFFPFLIATIGVLTEIAYGLNNGIEANAALNRAVAITSSTLRDETNSDSNIIKEEIQQKAKEILIARKVPFSDSFEVEVLEVDDFFVAIGKYTYTYTFKLVNTFFQAIPDEFHFTSVALVNKAHLKPNNFTLENDALTSTFNNYAIQGGETLEENVDNLFNSYQNKWQQDFENAWQDFVNSKREEQEANIQEGEEEVTP